MRSHPVSALWSTLCSCLLGSQYWPQLPAFAFSLVAPSLSAMLPENVGAVVRDLDREPGSFWAAGVLAAVVFVAIAGVRIRWWVKPPREGDSRTWGFPFPKALFWGAIACGVGFLGLPLVAGCLPSVSDYYLAGLLALWLLLLAAWGLNVVIAIVRDL
jgi:hypothetical protein